MVGGEGVAVGAQWTLPNIANVAKQAADGSANAKAALRGIVEHDFSVAVREHAEIWGWTVWYMRRSGYMKDGKWHGLTPKGEPDLRIAKRGHKPHWLELKREGGYASTEQRASLIALGPYGGLYKPRDAVHLIEMLAQEATDGIN